MNLLLQNPLWIATALAAVPLIAHLFSRTRPKIREFPSLFLLNEAVKRVMKVRQPRDWWLLAIRTLAALALALAFLQPTLFSSLTADRGGARTSILLVDRTASMGFAEGTRSRYGQSAAAAADYLENLPAGSVANVLWISQHPHAVLPEPGSNLAFLRAELLKAGVKPEAGDVRGAMALAAEALSNASGARELVVFSDFQASAWRETNWDLPQGTVVIRVAAGESGGENLALGGIEIEPTRPVAGVPANLTCRVRNFSSEAKKVVLLAQAGEERQQTPVEVLPWSETLAVLPVTFANAGLIPVKVTMTEDRFPGDDIRYALAEVRGSTRAVVVGSDPTAQTWLRALAALGAEVRRIDFAALNSAVQADLLVLSGWDGSAPETLRELALNGTALVVHPATTVTPQEIDLLVEPQTTGATDKPRIEARDQGWGLAVAKEEHPVFAMFASGAYGNPVGANVRRRVNRTVGERWTSLVRFEDGPIALALAEVSQGQRQGVIGLWNVDLGESDWAARSGFVTLAGELTRFLNTRRMAASAREIAPGDSLQFLGIAGQPIEDLRLLNESGEVLPIEIERESATSVNPAIPGSYRWVLAGSEVNRAVVNFPEQESDLRRLETEVLEKLPGNLTQASTAATALASEGTPLWPWLIAFAALALLLEAAVLFFGPDRERTQAATTGGVA